VVVIYATIVLECGLDKEDFEKMIKKFDKYPIEIGKILYDGIHYLVEVKSDVQNLFYFNEGEPVIQKELRSYIEENLKKSKNK